MLVRYLGTVSANPSEVDAYSFRDSLRIGAEKGLVDDVEAWFEFRKARNQTSHTYDRVRAQEVFQSITPFACAAKDLLAKLTKDASSQ